MEEELYDIADLYLPEVPIVIDPKSNVPVMFSSGHEIFLREERIDLTSYTDKDCIINLINNTLSKIGEEIKSIRYSHDNFSWILEYGTKPLEEKVRTFRERLIVELGRYNATHAACVAFEKIILKGEEEKLFEDPPNFNKKLWSVIKIKLGYCPHYGSFILPISRIRGCRNSYSYVSMIIKEKLNEYKLNYLWNHRKNYLMLLEGLPLETGRDNVLTYLLNPEIVKEVCSNMV